MYPGEIGTLQRELLEGAGYGTDWAAELVCETETAAAAAADYARCSHICYSPADATGSDGAGYRPGKDGRAGADPAARTPDIHTHSLAWRRTPASKTTGRTSRSPHSEPRTEAPKSVVNGRYGDGGAMERKEYTLECCRGFFALDGADTNESGEEEVGIEIDFAPGYWE